MNEAVTDLLSRLSHADFPEPALEDLAELAERASEWPPSGWPLGAEYAATTELVRITSQIPAESKALILGRLQTNGPWASLFLASELLTEVRASADSSVGLWNSRSVRLQMPGNIVFFAMRAVAENHLRNNFDLGWHIHPTEDGRHLGYRLFFDAERTDQDLSWERHGEQGGRNKCRLGDPQYDVLSIKRSRQLHSASLEAVERTRLINNGRQFEAWAPRFGKPCLNKAYVAHPPVTCPTPWCP